MKIQRVAVVLFLGLLLLTTFACGGSAGQGSSSTPTPTWATYSNSSRGISMQYPQNWVKTENQSGSAYVIIFSSPAHSDSTYAERLSIFVSHSEQPVVNLSDWVDTCILTLRTSQTGFNLSESSATTLAGMPARKLVYTGKSIKYPSNYSTECMQIISVKDNNIVYTIGFAADITTYDSDVKTAQQMIDSFTIY